MYFEHPQLMSCPYDDVMPQACHASSKSDNTDRHFIIKKLKYIAN